MAAPSEDLIRCPDWQRYAPLAVRARPADGQTPERFATRTSRPNETRQGQVAGQGAGQAGAELSRASACAHKIRPGDTLGKIAARHLGSAARWTEIAAANPGVKPAALRVGTSLKLPCAALVAATPPAGQTAQTAGQGAGKEAAPRAGTGVLARLFGTKPAQSKPVQTKPADTQTAAVKPAPLKPAQSKPARSKPAQAASKPSAATPAATPAAATPKPAPLPVWTARKGEDFAAVLARWGKEAGYRVVTHTTDAWTLRVPVQLRGDFETVVSQLVEGLGSDGPAPPVRIYANKVVRLGGLP